MMKLYHLLFTLMAVCMTAFHGVAQDDDKTVVFENVAGGEFAQQFGSRMDLLNITLSGPINQEDLKVISGQYSLQILDMKNGKLLAGKVGFYTYGNDELCACLGYLPLTDLTLPSTLKSIQNKALTTNAAMLKNLHVTSPEPPACPEGAFKDYSYQNCALHVPATALNAYKVHEVWSRFATIKTEGGEMEPAYRFAQKEYKLHHNDKVDLTFNEPLPEGAVLKLQDSNVAILKGTQLHGDLVGETEISLTVGSEVATAKVIVEPVSATLIDPFIDWSMNKEQILEKLGQYPHVDTEHPSAGYDAVDFDFGNMGQKYVRYSFLQSTGKLESVIIAYVSPVDYKNRNIDAHMSERFHLKLVKNDLSKVFVRDEVTLETFVTASIAMASYKPTPVFDVDKNVIFSFKSDKDIKKTVDLFVEASKPFTIDRGDGVEISYGAGSYGFDAVKTVPVELGGTEFKILGQGVTKIALQNQGLTSVSLPDDNTLQFLHVGSNKLTELNVQSCKDLEHLVCANNELTTLDVKKNKKLKYLSAYLNFLNSVQVDGLSLLEVLYVNQNKIKKIDLTGCTAMVQFWIDDNAVKELKMPENYNNLRALFLRNCRLDVDSLERIFNKLPDVNHEEINADNEVWMRRVKIDRTPGVEGKINLVPAQNKGWIFDVKGASGLEDAIVMPQLVLYPTVASQSVVVETSKLPSKACILTLDGSCVKTLELNNPLQQVDVSTLATGIYLFKAEGCEQAVKFVKK